MPNIKYKKGCCCGTPTPPTGVNPGNCACTNIPATLDLYASGYTSTSAPCRAQAPYTRYHSQTLTYRANTGDIPSDQKAVSGGRWTSPTFTLTDLGGNPYEIFYEFYCQGSTFRLVSHEHIAGSTYDTPRLLYAWSTAVAGNSCNPFSLCVGDDQQSADSGENYSGCGGTMTVNCGGSYANNTQSPNRSAIAYPSTIHPARSAATTTPRVGWIVPCLLQGGAEAMTITTTHALGNGYTWVGCANLGASQSAVVADVAALMPVTTGMAAARALAAKCDVILTWAVLDYGQLYAGITAPKTIFVAHRPDAWGSGSASMLAQVDRIVAVSQYAAAAVPSSLTARTTTIPNAIDPVRLPATAARSRAAVRASWGVKATDQVCLYLGRLATEKDADAVYRAASASLLSQWVVVGDGDLYASMKAEAPTNMHVVGSDDDRTSCYLAADRVLVPSQFESFGLTIAEACWLGVPVISTATGIAAQYPGLTRTIPVNATGLQIVAAVAADQAIGNTTAQRVAAAKTIAQRDFTSARLGSAYASVISGLLNSRSAPLDLSRLDLNARVELCPFARECSCPNGVRACDRPDRPDRVSRATCLACQRGELEP